jgi:hypothetical protein
MNKDKSFTIEYRQHGSEEIETTSCQEFQFQTSEDKERAMLIFLGEVVGEHDGKETREIKKVVMNVAELTIL